MKIRKLQLKNIGVFDDEIIEFQPCPNKDKSEIHILTGENGSGKSTILIALASVFREKEHDAFLKRLRQKDYENECIISLDDGNEYGFSQIVHSNKNNPNVLVETTPYSNSIQRNKLLENYVKQVSVEKSSIFNGLEFAVFAYSGYRFIKSEKVELLKKYEENPLKDSLDFIKSYETFSINQWIANNLSQRALAKEQRNLKLAKRFNNNIKNLAACISEITNFEIDFKLNFTAKELVLIKDNQELDFDVLPDGLKSLISWIGDLLMRLDSLKWEKDPPVFEREIILFLDEIEIHLHPAWQRKVLPVVQKLFKNSQIFVSTHSPFVVNSVDDAWVYKLKLENGKAKVAEPIRTENSNSITQVLREIFEIYGLFGDDVQKNIDKLEKLRNKILSNGSNEEDEKEFLRIAKILYDEPSDQVKNIVKGELEQLSEIKDKKFSI